MSGWDERFLEVAGLVRTWSKDPSTQVGAVVVQDRRIVATGYNGFPSGIADDERLHDRAVKYDLTVHAEMNAILNAAKAGISLDGATMYVNGLCVCKDCAKAVIASGIKRVVAAEPTKTERWADSLAFASLMFEEAGVGYKTT